MCVCVCVCVCVSNDSVMVLTFSKTLMTIQVEIGFIREVNFIQKSSSSQIFRKSLARAYPLFYIDLGQSVLYLNLVRISLRS